MMSHTTNDWLSQLPQELRSEIAKYLPTSDFLNGRLVLRGPWDIFDGQQFWATRFLEPGAERSWLFESFHPHVSSLDWRVYVQANFRRSRSAVRRNTNRRRIWELALRLKAVLSLPPLDLHPVPKTTLKFQILSGISRKLASGSNPSSNHTNPLCAAALSFIDTEYGCRPWGV